MMKNSIRRVQKEFAHSVEHRVRKRKHDVYPLFLRFEQNQRGDVRTLILASDKTFPAVRLKRNCS